MIDILKQLWHKSEKCIWQYALGRHDWWYQGSQTCIKWLKNEINEVIVEIEGGNPIFLEDELGDVLWDYFCLLHSLDIEWRIKKKRVFERALKKFSERIGNDMVWKNNWNEIKIHQKQELTTEYEKLGWTQHAR